MGGAVAESIAFLVLGRTVGFGRWRVGCLQRRPVAAGFTAGQSMGFDERQR